MSGHPLVFVSVGIAAVVAAVYIHFRGQRQRYREYRHEEPPIRPVERRILGPCGMCEGVVSVIDGFKAPCQHFVHYTCNADVARQFKDLKFEWSQVCRACLRGRMNRRPQNEPENSGLRHRIITEECANCGRKFLLEEQDIVTLKCKHRVHRTCWERMIKSGSSTCPTCIEP